MKQQNFAIICASMFTLVVGCGQQKFGGAAEITGVAPVSEPAGKPASDDAKTDAQLPNKNTSGDGAEPGSEPASKPADKNTSGDGAEPGSEPGIANTQPSTSGSPNKPDADTAENLGPIEVKINPVKLGYQQGNRNFPGHILLDNVFQDARRSALTYKCFGPGCDKVVVDNSLGAWRVAAKTGQRAGNYLFEIEACRADQTCARTQGQMVVTLPHCPHKLEGVYCVRESTTYSPCGTQVPSGWVCASTACTGHSVSHPQSGATLHRCSYAAPL